MIYDKIGQVENYELLSRVELVKAEHALGREMLRSLLQIHFEITDYEIEIGEHGKPYLVNLPYHFSISHSNGLVACAVADTQIGVDIERRSTMSPEKIRSISARFFTPEEIDALKGADYSAQMFYVIWTRKEALSKYFGTPFMESIGKSSLDTDDIITTINENYIYSIMIKK